MPTYTENYNLTKPVRGAEIVDINVINGNMDTIDAIMHSTQISLAEPYDDTRTSANPYNTGDLCLQDFHVYRCDEDGVYGAWDATKWTQTTLAENTGGGTASEVSYDNTDSGLEAENVQDAVDELKEAIDDIPQTEVEVEASEEGQSIATIEVNGDSTSINLPAIEGSGSGAVVTIEDALNKAISKLSFYIEPVQSGSGDPSPQNIRPISGWTGAEVTRVGINVWDEEWEAGGLEEAHGSETTNANFVRSGYILFKGDSGIYGYSSDNRQVVVYFYDINKAYLRFSVITNTAYTTPSNTAFIRIRINNINRDITKGIVSINYPSTDTDYHAYQGQTYSLTWQSTAGTVYGGRITVFEDGSGELEVTDKGFICDGSENWAEYQGKYLLNDIIEINENKPTFTGYLVNKYKFAGNGATASSDVTQDKTVYMQRAYGRVWINDTDITSVEALKASLQQTNLQVAYPLNESITYTFPAGTFPSIEMLKGINNIWSNTGDIEELQYQKDLLLYLAELEARIKALEEA